MDAVRVDTLTDYIEWLHASYAGHLHLQEVMERLRLLLRGQYYGSVGLLLRRLASVAEVVGVELLRAVVQSPLGHGASRVLFARVVACRLTGVMTSTFGA